MTKIHWCQFCFLQKMYNNERCCFSFFKTKVFKNHIRKIIQEEYLYNICIQEAFELSLLSPTSVILQAYNNLNIFLFQQGSFAKFTESSVLSYFWLHWLALFLCTMKVRRRSYNQGLFCNKNKIPINKCNYFVIFFLLIFEKRKCWK